MFKSRREAKDWCAEHHPGSPIREIGANFVIDGQLEQWSILPRDGAVGCCFQFDRRFQGSVSPAASVN